MTRVDPGALTRAAGFARGICRAPLDWAGEGTRPYVVRAFGQLVNHVLINLYPLGWTRNIAFVWSDPVADDARTKNIGDELIAFAVPNEQGGAGTSAAIDFEKVCLLVGRDFDFVLHYAFGPEHAHHVGLFGLAEADGQIRRVLAEVSVRAVDFV